MACGGRDGSAYLWSLETKQLLHTIEAHTRRINCLVFDSSSSRFATGGDDRKVCVWNCASGKNEHTLKTAVARFCHLRLCTTAGWRQVAPTTQFAFGTFARASV